MVFYSHFTVLYVYYVTIDIAQPCSCNINFIFTVLKKSSDFKNPRYTVGAQETFLIIIKFENSCAAKYYYNIILIY